ncbi:MAG: heme biosynthesis protein HemY [Methylobacillus sp.]|nr:heme biosynthesis protein HemY [Methylobacillus sp.]
MKFLIGLLFILAVAVALALVAGSSDGYVLIVQPPYRISIPLSLLIIALIAGFFALYALVRLVKYTLRLPQNVRAYKREQRRKEAQRALLESLRAVMEGRYAKAEKAASTALNLGDDADLSALVAARAAHKLNQPDQRDHYLAEAERRAPNAVLSRLLTQAEMQLDDRMYASALRTLQQLDKIEPNHIPALRLQLKVLQRLNNWEQVLAVLAQLEKRDAIGIVQLRQLRHHARAQLLERRAGHREELLRYWQTIPENERLDTQLTRTAARALIAAGESAAAARAIEMSLTKQWDSSLAALYGDSGNDTVRQLEQAEAWLRDHHDDAGLLLALGKLCIRRELWGKAQSYLEASLGMQPASESHLALARLLERMGNQQEAYRHYRESLEWALGRE